MKQELFSPEYTAEFLHMPVRKLLWQCHTNQIKHVIDGRGRIAFEWHHLADMQIRRSRKPMSVRQRWFGHE